MSTLKADTIQNTSGGAATLTKQSPSKSWINFDGTNTISSRGSFNHSSLTDEGTGSYTITVTNSFADVDFCSLISAGQTQTNPANKIAGCATSNSSSVLTRTSNSAGTAQDQAYVFLSFFGDLA